MSFSALSAVMSISVEYSCTSGTAMVSWARVFGADSYRAVATGSGRTVLSCTSQGTECQITGVGCGEDYMVQVTAVSKSCESKVNTTSHFVTGKDTETKEVYFWTGETVRHL